MQPQTTYQFALAEPPQCRCNTTGYCPHCGTYEPAVHDPQVLSIIYPERSRNNGQRIVRKPLEK